MTVERLEQATLPALQRRLRRGEYHIFHFIGHGAFDERAQDGVLLLEDEAGGGRPVSGQELGTLLRDHTSLRLAILNACEGGRASRTNPFAGTAQSLVQQGIPAVIAMQFEVADETAILFSHEFYAAVADGYAVDTALAEARKAIFARNGDLEWATPVLYMRAPDGRIFDVIAKATTLDSVSADLKQTASPTSSAPPAPSPRKPWMLIAALLVMAIASALALSNNGGWLAGASVKWRSTPTEASITAPAPTLAPTLAPTFAPTAELPTRTPTDTPTPLPPTLTPTKTRTSTPEPQVLVAVNSVNMRSGPGTVYPIVASYPLGTELSVRGRNEPGSERWLWVIAVPDGRQGWMLDEFLKVAVDKNSLPVIPAPPTPTPIPTATRTMTPQVTPTATSPTPEPERSNPDPTRPPLPP